MLDCNWARKGLNARSSMFKVLGAEAKSLPVCSLLHGLTVVRAPCAYLLYPSVNHHKLCPTLLVAFIYTPCLQTPFSLTFTHEKMGESVFQIVFMMLIMRERNLNSDGDSHSALKNLIIRYSCSHLSEKNYKFIPAKGLTSNAIMVVSAFLLLTQLR